MNTEEERPGDFRLEVGDLITEDWQTFREVGGSRWPVLRFSEELEWSELCKLIQLYFDEQQFWPNVWWISDHGNAHLLNIYYKEG